MTAAASDSTESQNQKVLRAMAVLKDSTYCKEFTDDFLEALARKMYLVEAKDGHIFCEEGQPIKDLYLIEEGTLARTKLSVDTEDDLETTQSMIRDQRPSQVWSKMEQHSVLIDIITGRGRMSGMLHNIHTSKKSFATTVAKGPAKVWVMNGEDFRSILSANSKFSWQMMVSMSKEIKTGSKSLEALVRRARGSIGTNGESQNVAILRVLCYDSTSWVTENFKPAIERFNRQQDDESDSANKFHIFMDYTTDRLDKHSATYAAGYDAVCTFVNDNADADIIQTLSLMGVKMIAQRAAGFDRIDTKAARAYGLTVARVPAYSPYAVAEHAITLLMTVNRKIHRATNRVRMGNFALDAGLMGMDIHGKTVGVMGTGKIGQILCSIISGFGAKLICYDVFESDVVKELGGEYVSKEEIFAQSDVLFLMMPLLATTRHTINEKVLPKLKRGMILINTSRGALIETSALLQGLRDGIISGVGLDVYENEGEYFFQDWSGRQIQDPYLAILLGLNNVVLTAHQAFFTTEAVTKIVDTTIQNFKDFREGKTGLDHPNNVIPALLPQEN